jgi:hypothetical protein
MEDACTNSCVEEKEEEEEEEEECTSDCEGLGLGDCATNSCVNQCTDAEDDDGGDGGDSPCEAAEACADAADDDDGTEDQVEECLSQNGLGDEDMSDYMDAFGDDPPPGCDDDDAPEECTCAEQCAEADDSCTSSCASDACADEDEDDCLDDCEELDNDCLAGCGTCSTTAECEELITCDQTDSEGNVIERACCAPVYDDDDMPVLDEYGNEVRECACCCIVGCDEIEDIFDNSSTVFVASRAAVRGLIGKHWQGDVRIDAAQSEIDEIYSIMGGTIYMGVDYCGAKVCKPIISAVKKVKKYATFGVRYAEAFNVADPDEDDECLCTIYTQFAVPPNSESAYYHVQRCCTDQHSEPDVCDIDCAFFAREPRCDSLPGAELDTNLMFGGCDSNKCLPGAIIGKEIDEYWIFPGSYMVPYPPGEEHLNLCEEYGCIGAGQNSGSCVFFNSLPSTLRELPGSGLFKNSQNTGKYWRSGGTDKRTPDLCDFQGIAAPAITYVDYNYVYMGPYGSQPAPPPGSGLVQAYVDVFDSAECNDICVDYYESKRGFGDPDRAWDVIGCYRADTSSYYSCANAGHANDQGGQCITEAEFCSSPADCGPDYEDCGGTEVCEP